VSQYLVAMALLVACFCAKAWNLARVLLLVRMALVLELRLMVVARLRLLEPVEMCK
jgi:hypothetical protein